MLLTYFDPEKETVIQLDTSNTGLGAAFLQEGKPIAFVLKSLTKREQHQVVVFGCERFQTYIYGCAFQVESNHKPLEMINLKNLIAVLTHLQGVITLSIAQAKKWH